MTNDDRPVLVVTNLDDPTADFVIAELYDRDVPVVRFDSGDFPATLSCSASIGDTDRWRGSVRTPSRRADLGAVRSMYYRRPSGFAFPHLGRQDERFAIAHARYGLGGILTSLPGCLYVNHPNRIGDAEYKPAGLAAAAAVGFALPPTLITNVPDDARAFIKDHGPAIFKPISVPLYLIDGKAQTAAWEPVTEMSVGQEEWLRLVYSDETWMTQFDGRDIDWADPKPISNAVPTSSSTLPSLVVRMLEDLDVHAGMNVLEIGTGTGYSTALMCHRLGSGCVTSIETDEGVARRAREALAGAGYTPHLLVGDGRAGHLDGAPYDRLIATCGFRNIPPAWLEQVEPGGVILTTLRGWMRSLGLAKLIVTGDSASGWFSEDEPSFMIARQQDAPESLGMVPGPDDGTRRRVTYGPEVLTSSGPGFMAQLAAPDARFFSMPVDGGPVSTFVLDGVTDSFAVLAPTDRGWEVRQGGPRRLWDAVESAVATWEEYGSPGTAAFGVTVSRDAQVVWLGNPNGQQWRLPA